jgi:protein-disulfide isomerase
VDSGKLRYTFRDFPLESIHPKAAKAAEAARCAGDQAKYWEMHDRLFANQRALDPKNLIEHANAIGLDESAFKECLDQGKYTAAVAVDVEEGDKLGIRGTPTIVLGISAGDRVRSPVIIRGAQSFAIFKAEIDKLLSQATGQKQ